MPISIFETCQNDMICTSAKFPITIGAAFGANIDGTPIVCGGSYSTR